MPVVQEPENKGQTQRTVAQLVEDIQTLTKDAQYGFQGSGAEAGLKGL